MKEFNHILVNKMTKSYNSNKVTYEFTIPVLLSKALRETHRR